MDHMEIARLARQVVDSFAGRSANETAKAAVAQAVLIGLNRELAGGERVPQALGALAVEIARATWADMGEIKEEGA